MKRLLCVAWFISLGCGQSPHERAVEKLRNPDRKVRHEGIEFLQNNNGRQYLPQIIELLHEEIPEIKLDVIRCLAMLHDERSVEPLLSEINDFDSDIAVAATYALISMGDRGVEALKSIESDPKYRFNFEIRSRAIWALGHTKHSELAEYFISKINNGSEQTRIRVSATRALGCLGHAKTFDTLRRVVKDSSNSADIRCGAAYGLAGLMDPRGLEVVVALRQTDADPAVRACLNRTFSVLYEPIHPSAYCRLNSHLP